MVRSRSPSVLMSRRPTATTRGMSSGRTSKTVCRPSGSRAVVTKPRGLWKIHSRVRSRVGSGSPSTRIASSSLTLRAGDVMTSPFTLTRPSRIIASASRREARPARAIALAMRSPAKVASASGCSPGAGASTCSVGATRRRSVSSPAGAVRRRGLGASCSGTASLPASVEGCHGVVSGAALSWSPSGPDVSSLEMSVIGGP